MKVIVYAAANGSVVVVWPAFADQRETETEADFLGRVASASVPVDAQHVIMDASALPQDAAPEHWRVNWSNGDIVVSADSLLASEKAVAKLRVATRADAIAAQITGVVPLAEQLSWPSKEVAALAHQAGTASAPQVALLAAEAGVTGETVDVLATKIIANAATYNTAAGLIAGQRRKTMAAIDALTNIATFPADLAAILATAEAEAEALLATLG